ncbi:MAG: hypothetical protein B6U72_03750 [Candidatus Altiarchaeales archaeon ex4484_2]|nr:MAG: hypothetical protein B6U72_03750 [Candidatus Altiarchaeales archaeon ex4484_2]
MFDDMYSQMIKRVSYKKLMVLPIVVVILMSILIAVNGIPQGLDFAGGSWVEVTLDEDVEKGVIDAIENELEQRGAENLDVYAGAELGSEIYKITISTTTVIDKDATRELLENYLGELRENDVAEIKVESEPKPDVKDRIENRLKGSDISFNKETSTLIVTAMDINADELGRALDLYMEETTSVYLKEKNYRIESIGKTLGDKFWEQGLYAVLFSYLLIIAVIFFVFRDFIPSMAIILAASFDAVFALGGMSAFNMLLEPAALVSLLMLIGYSVDSDILLTTRVLKTSKGTVNERIDSAMKTGLTMTGTTMGVMLVILLVTSTFIKIPALPNIAIVLLMGLVADLVNTWFMNAGILKWYVEEKGGKFNILGKR